MPISDRNDSEMYQNIGKSWAYRDTARWRHDPLFNCGPIEKDTKHYLPAYVKPLNELVFDEQKALAFEGMAIQTTSFRENRLEVADPSQHVVPRPLIEKIVAISGIGRRPDPKFWYYESSLRESWAIYELQKADEAAALGRFADAANHYAEVFGTLMPGMLCKKSTPQESECADRSWRGLTFFVEPKMLMESLREAAHAKFSKSEETAGIRSLGDAIALAQNKFFKTKIGPRQLRIAEQLQETEQEIIRLEEKLRSPQSGYVFVDVKRMSYRPMTIMLLSEIIKFTAWGWNFGAEEAQLLALPKSFVHFLTRIGDAKAVVRVSRDDEGFHYRRKDNQTLSVSQVARINSLPTMGMFELRRMIEGRINDERKMDLLKHQRSSLMADLGFEKSDIVD